MSYLSTVRGELTIKPPLKWRQIHESRFYAEGMDRRAGRGIPSAARPDVVLDVLREDTATEEGFNTRLYCTRAVPYQGAPYTAGTLVEDIEELCAAFPGHTIRGQIVLYDEEPGSVRRVIADDDGVREERARLVWPDGTEVELP